MISHIFFDFFGTLTHYSVGTEGKAFNGTASWLLSKGFKGDEATFREIWKRAFKAVNDEAAKTLDEFPMYRVVEAFLSDARVMVSEKEIAEFIDIYLSDWNQGVRYIPHIESMIERLSLKYKLAVVSNTHFEPLVLTHLEKMGILPFMQFVLTSIAFGKRKPHPLIFEEALDLCSVSKDQCLYVGDSYTDDYEGARHAGIRCLLIDPEQRSPINSEDRIDSILHLEKFLS